VIACQDCRTEIWVSPSGRDIIKIHNCEALCPACATARAIRDENVQVQPPSLAQLHELVANGKSIYEAVQVWMRMMGK
jgi:hypothetical protein